MTLDGLIGPKLLGDSGATGVGQCLSLRLAPRREQYRPVDFAGTKFAAIGVGLLYLTGRERTASCLVVGELSADEVDPFCGYQCQTQQDGADEAIPLDVAATMV